MHEDHTASALYRLACSWRACTDWLALGAHALTGLLLARLLVANAWHAAGARQEDGAPELCRKQVNLEEGPSGIRIQALLMLRRDSGIAENK
jgi:hypothetical protein